MDKVYPIEKLPSILFLGKRTENEVTKVGIDCAAYLALWPDMTFTVWPTLPNADECYAAAQVQTENGILTWTINSYDVSVAGDGTVEIVGVTPDNSKKISHTVRTRIDQTTLPDRAMPGDPDTLFVEAVAKEAGRAEKAAQEAAEARKGAEAERKAAEEAAEKVLAGEGGRVEAETLREENERARVKSETERVNAENTRKSSETARVKSETERVNAESTRKRSETTRENSETERVNAENTRKNNETTRENSETKRVNAETLREENERARVKNEEERVNAENARKNNETTRENSETKRVNAEKLREENERARVKSEEERVNAENTRKSSETARTNSETKRVNAENKRAEDEKQRIEAEKRRELAEEKREEVIAHVPKIDQTLSHDGEAADAGAVGRRLKEIEDSSGVHRYGILWDGNNAACARLYDAVGLRAEAYNGVYAPLRNDFDSRLPWSGRKLVNVDLDEYQRLKTAGKSFEQAIVAWENDADFALDGSNGFVGVYTPEFWCRQEMKPEGLEVVVADQPLPGYIHFAATIGGRYFACEDGQGGITSCAGKPYVSGTIRDTSYSLAKIHQLAKAKQMTLDDAFTWSADSVLMAVEFASLNSQTVLGDGVSSLYRESDDKPLIGGTGNVMILPKALADIAIPGAVLDIGTTRGSSQVDRRVVVTTREYVENPEYKEVEFDGEPLTFTADHFASIHGLTNTEDAEIGSASGYIGTRYKSHAYYRGRVAHAHAFRYVLGLYRQSGTGHIWYAKDRDEANAYDALDTEKHVDSGHALPYNEAGEGLSGYVKALGQVKQLPLVPLTTQTGGNTANPVGDYTYIPSLNTGNTVAVIGGNAGNGAGCGRFYSYWGYAASGCWWCCAALPFLI